jgi:predicted RNase H-like nuclease
MTVVLGVDAAWTLRQPSGVALLETTGVRPKLLAVAPSYRAFLRAASGEPVHWDRATGEAPPIIELLNAATALAAAPVDVIAIDMPLATIPITARRAADNAISAAFGAAKCATHSPNPERPGRISRIFARQLRQKGFPLATARHEAGVTPALIEVYPHVALLRLSAKPERLRYKAGKTTTYWPKSSLDWRKRLIAAEMNGIIDILASAIDGLRSRLPAVRRDDLRSLSALKRLEDALDAIVCAWAGLCYARGQASAYGDETAAIWVPRFGLCHAFAPRPSSVSPKWPTNRRR